ncbi:MAG TPA: VOC family protein [Thermodesulfobacteriota bacterium]|nr:VOC family protein [Thermodesulfobacteriota bacterium]
MNITGIMIFCEDIKNMTAFYRDVVGLTPLDTQPFPAHKFFKFVSKKGAELCLHSGTKPNGGRQKLMLYTDDIDGLVKRVKAYKPRVRLPEPDKDGNIVFDFRDPEQNRIQVYSNAIYRNRYT